jgi:hypothetical protein
VTKGKRNLYLYLAIACFVGIIAIFVIDGYLGVYDTFYITANEHEQEISPDYWLHFKHRGYSYPYSVGAEWGRTVRFRYEIDNRRFSSYPTPIKATVWKENEKILDLFSEDRLIKPFDKAMVEWALDSEQLQSQGFSVGEYTVKIEREGMERKIIVGYHVTHSEPVYPIYPPPQ